MTTQVHDCKVSFVVPWPNTTSQKCKNLYNMNLQVKRCIVGGGKKKVRVEFFKNILLLKVVTIKTFCSICVSFKVLQQKVIQTPIN
jgi:hypothetical protein